jgi:hypothetical protein
VKNNTGTLTIPFPFRGNGGHGSSNRKGGNILLAEKGLSVQEKDMRNLHKF